MDNYIWDKNIRWIPGWEGRYAATIDGKIASYHCGKYLPKKPRWLTPKKVFSKRGRPYRMCVYLCKDGKRHTHSVGRLVLLTFVGQPPANMECCHGPAGAFDNNLSNLSWGTHQKNSGADRNRDHKGEFSSDFIGVYRDQHYNRVYWCARIRLNGKRQFLGLFPYTTAGEIKAALAYDEAAIKFHGKDAAVNFLPDPLIP